MLRLSTFQPAAASIERNCIFKWGFSPTLVWEMPQATEQQALIATLSQSGYQSNPHIYNYIGGGVVNFNSLVATASAVHYLRMEAV
jgi:hypothetical protein